MKSSCALAALLLAAVLTACVGIACELDRVVVSCVGVCRPAGGQFRIDVVLDAGDVESIGAGGYGEFPAEC